MMRTRLYFCETNSISTLNLSKQTSKLHIFSSRSWSFGATYELFPLNIFFHNFTSWNFKWNLRNSKIIKTNSENSKLLNFEWCIKVYFSILNLWNNKKMGSSFSVIIIDKIVVIIFPKIQWLWNHLTVVKTRVSLLFLYFFKVFLLKRNNT